MLIQHTFVVKYFTVSLVSFHTLHTDHYVIITLRSHLVYPKLIKP